MFGFLQLNQLKTDLRDLLYSHKWTPDAYLLAKAYVAEDDAKESTDRLPRIPLKQQARKLWVLCLTIIILIYHVYSNIYYNAIMEELCFMYGIGFNIGETSKFPFCDHKQTTEDDKRRWLSLCDPDLVSGPQ